MKLWQAPLIPFSWVFQSLVGLKNTLYDKKVFNTKKLDVPVISVGNLTMGGTGKTPIIAEILTWATKQNISVGVVSRGYGRKSSRVVEVVSPNPQEFGDEPAMLKNKFQHVPIFVGADRVSAIEGMLKLYKTKFILADDAFQHRRLGRDIDIVVIDCMEPQYNYLSLPAGRAREGFSSLRRANYVILSRINLIDSERRRQWIDFINLTVGDRVKVIECEYLLHRIVPASNSDKTSLAVNERVVLVSGVGSPKSVEAVLREKHRIAHHIIFDDHHNYSQADVKAIEECAKRFDAQNIVVTEKDFIKLAKLKIPSERYWVMELKPKLSLKIKELYEEITRLTI